jgi:hypothetical protein
VAADLVETIDVSRRNARWAISDIMRIGRSSIDLI